MIKKRIEKEQQLEIANKYRSGHTLSKLSVEYGISVSPIRKILQSLNVPIRRKGKITDSSPERDKKIHDLYKNKDITLQEIGAAGAGFGHALGGEIDGRLGFF